MESSKKINNSEWLVPQSEISFDYLTQFNRKMMFLHLVQGLFMVILGLFPFFYYDVDIYFMYSKVDTFFGLIFLGLSPEPQYAFSFPYVGVLVGSFLLFSALAHFLIAYPLNERYRNDLKKGINRVRWFEYAFSSSIMIVLIGMFFGVQIFWVLLLIFVSNALMNLCGLEMEELNIYTKRLGEKIKWLPYYLGVIAGAVPWIVITAYFINIGGNAPWFVYVIYIVELTFFNTFAINMILQYKKIGKWEDYFYGERVYQLLSLISKTALAWLVFIGVLSPV